MPPTRSPDLAKDDSARIRPSSPISTMAAGFPTSSASVRRASPLALKWSNASRRVGTASTSSSTAPTSSRRSTDCQAGGVGGLGGRSSTTESRATCPSLHSETVTERPGTRSSR